MFIEKFEKTAYTKKILQSAGEAAKGFGIGISEAFSDLSKSHSLAKKNLDLGTSGGWKDPKTYGAVSRYLSRNLPAIAAVSIPSYYIYKLVRNNLDPNRRPEATLAHY